MWSLIDARTVQKAQTICPRLGRARGVLGSWKQQDVALKWDVPWRYRTSPWLADSEIRYDIVCLYTMSILTTTLYIKHTVAMLYVRRTISHVKKWYVWCHCRVRNQPTMSYVLAIRAISNLKVFPDRDVLLVPIANRGVIIFKRIFQKRIKLEFIRQNRIKIRVSIYGQFLARSLWMCKIWLHRDIPPPTCLSLCVSMLSN